VLACSIHSAGGAPAQLSVLSTQVFQFVGSGVTPEALKPPRYSRRRLSFQDMILYRSIEHYRMQSAS
jgi:hypothetical protein